MRIVIRDHQSINTIDSEDTDIISLWLTEQCRNRMTRNASLPPAELEVWSSNQAEDKVIKAFRDTKFRNPIDAEAMLRFGAAILRIGHEIQAANATRR